MIYGSSYKTSEEKIRRVSYECRDGGKSSRWEEHLSTVQMWGRERGQWLLRKSPFKDQQIPRLDTGTHLECWKRSEGEQREWGQERSSRWDQKWRCCQLKLLYALARALGFYLCVMKALGNFEQGMTRSFCYFSEPLLRAAHIDLALRTQGGQGQSQCSR